MEVGCFTPAEKSSYAFTNSYEKKPQVDLFMGEGMGVETASRKIQNPGQESRRGLSLQYPSYELCWAELVRKVLTFLCQEHFAVISLWKIQFGSKLLAVSNQLHLLYPSHKWMGKGGLVHQSLLPLLHGLEICSVILEEEKTVLCNSSTKDKEEGKKMKSETKDIQLQSFWQELTRRKSVCVGFPGQRKQPVPCHYKIFTPTGKNVNDAEVIMSTQVDFFLKWVTAAVKAPSICCSRSRTKLLGMPPESLCRGRGIPPSPGRGPAAQGSMNIFPIQLGTGLPAASSREEQWSLHTQTIALWCIAVCPVGSFMTVFPLEDIAGTGESRL